jgi:hypothetical protein
MDYKTFKNTYVNPHLYRVKIISVAEIVYAIRRHAFRKQDRLQTRFCSQTGTNLGRIQVNTVTQRHATSTLSFP